MMGKTNYTDQGLGSIIRLQAQPNQIGDVLFARKKEGINKMNDYQKQAHRTSIPINHYRLTANQIYAGIGASNETGEVAGLIKKAIRGDYGEDPGTNPIFLKKLRKELGDSAWYIVELCTQFGFNFDDIMVENLEKLRKRAENGTIMGNGDDR